MRLLLISNDFPPRVGGIQSYLWNIYRRLAERGVQVRVLAPAFNGDAAFDAASGMEIVRWPGEVRRQTSKLRAAVRSMAADADVVAFGAVLPMNLFAASIDRPVVVHTHGFEVAWARLPGLRRWLRRIGDAAALVTVVSDFTREILEPALGTPGAVRMLRTGVDIDRFNPEVSGDEVRRRYGLEGRPVISCVSRLVPRKGQDTLIRALPAVRREVPDATLLIAGGGPIRARLERLARARGVADATVFAGEVSEQDLAAYYAAGDVFAMPCRSRFAGLEVEGLGLVYLEAQACARPAITGDSGGAPEAVVVGETGDVVAGGNSVALADSLSRLLGDPSRARAMGANGRRFVEESHRWESVVERYAGMIRAL
ncbi:MAG: glycosyltransferase family 4 protein [Actinomycetota bacterium]